MELKRTARNIAGTAGKGRRLLACTHLNISSRAAAGYSFAQAIMEKYQPSDEQGLPSASFVYLDPAASGEEEQNVGELITELSLLNKLHAMVLNQSYEKNYCLTVRMRCEQLFASLSQSFFWSETVRKLSNIYGEIVRESAYTEKTEPLRKEERIEKQLEAVKRETRLFHLKRPQKSEVTRTQKPRPFGMRFGTTALSSWKTEPAKQFFWKISRAPLWEQRLILAASEVSSLPGLMNRLKVVEKERWSQTLSVIRERAEVLLDDEEFLSSLVFRQESLPDSRMDMSEGDRFPKPHEEAKGSENSASGKLKEVLKLFSDRTGTGTETNAQKETFLSFIRTEGLEEYIVRLLEPGEGTKTQEEMVSLALNRYGEIREILERSRTLREFLDLENREEENAGRENEGLNSAYEKPLLSAASWYQTAAEAVTYLDSVQWESFKREINLTKTGISVEETQDERMGGPDEPVLDWFGKVSDGKQEASVPGIKPGKELSSMADEKRLFLEGILLESQSLLDLVKKTSEEKIQETAASLHRTESLYEDVSGKIYGMSDSQWAEFLTVLRQTAEEEGVSSKERLWMEKERLWHLVESENSFADETMAYLSEGIFHLYVREEAETSFRTIEEAVKRLETREWEELKEELFQSVNGPEIPGSPKPLADTGLPPVISWILERKGRRTTESTEEEKNSFLKAFALEVKQRAALYERSQRESHRRLKESKILSEQTAQEEIEERRKTVRRDEFYATSALTERSISAEQTDARGGAQTAARPDTESAPKGIEKSRLLHELLGEFPREATEDERDLQKSRLLYLLPAKGPENASIDPLAAERLKNLKEKAKNGEHLLFLKRVVHTAVSPERSQWDPIRLLRESQILSKQTVWEEMERRRKTIRREDFSTESALMERIFSMNRTEWNKLLEALALVEIRKDQKIYRIREEVDKLRRQILTEEDKIRSEVQPNAEYEQKRAEGPGLLLYELLTELSPGAAGEEKTALQKRRLLHLLAEEGPENASFTQLVTEELKKVKTAGERREILLSLTEAASYMGVKEWSVFKQEIIDSEAVFKEREALSSPASPLLTWIAGIREDNKDKKELREKTDSPASEKGEENVSIQMSREKREFLKALERQLFAEEWTQTEESGRLEKNRRLEEILRKSEVLSRYVNLEEISQRTDMTHRTETSKEIARLTGEDWLIFKNGLLGTLFREQKRKKASDYRLINAYRESGKEIKELFFLPAPAIRQTSLKPYRKDTEWFYREERGSAAAVHILETLRQSRITVRETEAELPPYDIASLVTARNGTSRENIRNTPPDAVRHEIKKAVAKQVEEQTADIQFITKTQTVNREIQAEAQTELKELLRRVEEQQKELEELKRKGPERQAPPDVSQISRAVMKKMRGQLDMEMLRHGR